MLLKPRFSMRSTLSATILLMGVLALAMALTTGEIYRREAVNSQQSELADLLQLSADEQLRELTERTRDLGIAMQSEPSFGPAFAAGGAALARELQKQYRQYHLTAERIHVQELIAWDRGYRALASATATSIQANPKISDCQELIQAAPSHRGTDRTGTSHALCLRGGRPRLAVLVPIGGATPAGYLEIVANPAPALLNVANRMGVPVRLRDAADQRIDSSPDWPAPDSMANALVAEYVLKTPVGAPAIKVAVLRDIGSLRKKLRHTQYLVAGLALAATVLGVLVALFVLDRTALRPLNTLAQHLRRVGRDKDHLAEPVAISGIAEVRDLAEDFNHMARELDRLYGSLEHLAFTDPLTNLPNRARFRDTLEESARQHASVRRPFALFLMDLDRFKNVNDTYGHQIGDLLLQEVSARLRSVLRGSDTITRLDNETIQELDTKMVARLGGDEFAAILPRVYSMDDATSVAHKLLIAMQEPFDIRGHVLSVGISIGIALYPQHGEDIDTLMHRADAAMYHAKNNQTGLAFPEQMQQAPLL